MQGLQHQKTRLYLHICDYFYIFAENFFPPMQIQNDHIPYHLQIGTSRVFSPQDIKDAFIYTESSTNLGHNAYIRLHLNELETLCQQHGEHFIYIPRLYQNLLHSENTGYYDPSGINIIQNLADPFSLPFLNNILSANGYIQHNKQYDEPDFFKAESLLLHKDEDDIYDCNFLGYDITNRSSDCILDILRSYYIERDGYAEEDENAVEEVMQSSTTDIDLSRLTRHCSTQMLNSSEADFIRRCTTEDVESCSDLPPYNADDHFDEESRQLLREVREKLDALRMKGFDSLLLSKILSQPQRLSRIYITKDYKILLQDYNKEVQMKPLPKTVYFLFLCHPEGIRFKELANYREELQHIYLRITHRTSDEKISKSLDDLCNPTNNSINEKCARIREAFLSVIDDDIARHYYITGARGEAKGIRLSQELRIIDEAKFGISIYDVFHAGMIKSIAKWMNNNKNIFPTNTESQEILRALISALRRANNKHINEMKNRLKEQLPLFSSNNTVASLDEVSINDAEGVANLISAVGDTRDRNMWEFYCLAEDHHPLLKEYIQSNDWQSETA